MELLKVPPRNYLKTSLYHSISCFQKIFWRLFHLPTLSRHGSKKETYRRNFYITPRPSNALIWTITCLAQLQFSNWSEMLNTSIKQWISKQMIGSEDSVNVSDWLKKCLALHIKRNSSNVWWVSFKFNCWHD